MRSSAYGCTHGRAAVSPWSELHSVLGCSAHAEQVWGLQQTPRPRGAGLGSAADTTRSRFGVCNRHHAHAEQVWGQQHNVSAVVKAVPALLDSQNLSDSPTLRISDSQSLSDSQTLRLSWTLDPGLWILDSGLLFRNPTMRQRLLSGTRNWIPRSWILDSGSWTLNPGFWTHLNQPNHAPEALAGTRI